MIEECLSVRCPKCHAQMTYVAALPHPRSPTMRKTTFVCHVCNRTRSYALSEEMAETYVANHGGPPLTDAAELPETT